MFQRMSPLTCCSKMAFSMSVDALVWDEVAVPCVFLARVDTQPKSSLTFSTCSCFSSSTTFYSGNRKLALLSVSSCCMTSCFQSQTGKTLFFAYRILLTFLIYVQANIEVFNIPKPRRAMTCLRGKSIFDKHFAEKSDSVSMSQ